MPGININTNEPEACNTLGITDKKSPGSCEPELPSISTHLAKTQLLILTYRFNVNLKGTRIRTFTALPFIFPGSKSGKVPTTRKASSSQP